MTKVALDSIIVPDIKLRGVQENDPAFQDLLLSINRHGVLQPLLVRPATEAGKYILIDGLQRYSCARKVGLQEIAVNIQGQVQDDEEALLLSIIMNAQRVDTKPHEYAKALRRYVRRKPEMDLEALGQELGKSKKWILDRLSLTKLDEPIGEMLDQGKISVKAGIGLALLPLDQQRELVAEAVARPVQEFYDKCVDISRGNLIEPHVEKEVQSSEFTVTPALRSRKEIVEEHELHVAFDREVKDEMTQEEVWHRALDWVLQLDSRSMDLRRDQHEQRMKKAKKQFQRLEKERS